MRAQKFFTKTEKIFAYKLFGIELSVLIVALMVGAYTACFSYFTILKHRTFKTYTWDLGIFNQAFWTTVHDGKLFYYTPELLINPSGNFFGIHFSPILFLVLPVYAIYPSPQILLIFQSFILALGGVPIYKLSMHILRNRTASLSFVLAYLLYPALHGINWFDFHMQAFLPLFLLSGMYFLETQNWKMYILFIILSLACEEHAAFIVLFIGLFIAFQYSSHLKIILKTKNFRDHIFLTTITTMALSVSWYLMTIGIRNIFFPINPSFISAFKASANWRVLGVSDPTSIPLYILLYPQKAFAALEYDSLVKIGYIVTLFGPLAFMSFHRLRYLVPAIPWFIYSLFSNYLPYYLIYSQYPAYVIAFIFISALHSITDNRSPRFKSKRLATIFLSSLMVFSVASPIGPIANTFYENGIMQLTQHEKLTYRILTHIPYNASVITQNNLFPHLSSRSNAYAFPIESIWSVNSAESKKFVIDALEKIDYVLVDIKTDLFAARELFNILKERNDFKVLAMADGIVLFKKNYKGAPSVLEPYILTYNCHNLTLYTGEVVPNLGSINVKVLHFNGSLGEAPIFWHSPRSILPPGRYAVNLRMKVDGGAGALFTLELCSDNGQKILKSKTFYNQSMQLGVWKDYTIYFVLEQALVDFELRAVNLSRNIDLYVDYLEVKQLAYNTTM